MIALICNFLDFTTIITLIRFINKEFYKNSIKYRTIFNLDKNSIEEFCKPFTMKNLSLFTTWNSIFNYFLNYSLQINKIKIKILEEFDLFNNFHLKKIVKFKGKTLEDLTLQNCFNITTENGFKNCIGKNLIRLKNLTINGNLFLNDETLDYIIKNCKTLQKLKILNCKKITWNFLIDEEEYNFCNVNNLQKIKLDNFNENFIKCLNNYSYFTKLFKIHLVFQNFINIENMIVTNKHLNYLKITKCNGKEDYYLNLFPFIEKLNFTKCKMITSFFETLYFNNHLKSIQMNRCDIWCENQEQFEQLEKRLQSFIKYVPSMIFNDCFIHYKSHISYFTVNYNASTLQKRISFSSNSNSNTTTTSTSNNNDLTFLNGGATATPTFAIDNNYQPQGNNVMVLISGAPGNPPTTQMRVNNSGNNRATVNIGSSTINNSTIGRNLSLHKPI
ncbi:hypothetical protein ABK040_004762 [Willaertia magna]